jgi:hypothetical protein
MTMGLLSSSPRAGSAKLAKTRAKRDRALDRGRLGKGIRLNEKSLRQAKAGERRGWW